MESYIDIGCNNHCNKLVVEFLSTKGGGAPTIQAVCFDGNPLVTDANAAVWARYLHRKVEKLVNEENMRSDLFHGVEREVEEELRWKRRERNKKELKRFPKLGFIPDGLDVDYAEKYGRFIDSAIQWTPEDRVEFLYQTRSLERMATKSVLRYFEHGRPDAVYNLTAEILRRLPRWIQREDMAGFFSRYKPRLRKLVNAICQSMTEAAIRWNNGEKLNEANALIERNQHEFVSWGLTPEDMLDLRPSAIIEGDPIHIEQKPSRHELRLKSLCGGR